MNVCARWRSVLRPWDLPSSPASCASPSQQGTWLYFFSPLPCVFFRFLSLSPFLSFSLSFSVFLFCFSSRKSKRGKGKGQKRKRKKGRYKPLSFHCEPCSERRKHLFVQDPQTCKCSCKFTDSRCKSRQLELNERTCRCEKPRR